MVRRGDGAVHRLDIRSHDREAEADRGPARVVVARAATERVEQLERRRGIDARPATLSLRYPPYPGAPLNSDRTVSMIEPIPAI